MFFLNFFLSLIIIFIVTTFVWHFTTGDSRTGLDHWRRLKRTEKTMLTKSAVYQKRKQYGHSIKVRIGIVGCLRRGLEKPGDAHCPPSTRMTWTQFFFSDWGPLLCVENTSELGRPKWSLCWGFSRCLQGPRANQQSLCYQ